MITTELVEVHMVRLSRIGERDWARLTTLCSPDECARAARFLCADAGRRSLLTRGVARALLAARLDVAPDAIALRPDANGKPRVEGHGNLRLSIGHAADIAVIALSSREVGVDVEAQDPALDVDVIMRRFFLPDEAAQLLGLPAAARRVAFFRSWTRREALAKARGTGLRGPFRELRVPTADRPLLVPTAAPGDGQWTIADIDAPEGYAAAVAAAGDGWRLVARTWEDVSAERLCPRYLDTPGVSVTRRNPMEDPCTS